ncbi:methionyl-tRNA formyltransferase [Ghiorsea bivora]|uniref:methionyl-tRNA formyltransferase n=1 Tax=Ghiorsea bivora TaxID=1485545 RepID=UPI000AFC88F5|nr:methionyl-tRNA formyltransferase [Ghiorsea bivora]
MIKVIFAGTPAFSVGCLHALLQADDVDVVGVVSQPDRKSGRGMKLTPSPVKKAALASGIDVITPEKLRDNDEALAWLKAKECDVLVVVAFGMILPLSWLETPKVAPINVHASLLPRWRGAAPIERALLSGDKETGVCIMQMEEGLDTGGIYLEKRIPITAESTGYALWAALEALGAEALLESLPKIVSGELQPVPQDENGVTYAKKITNEERIVDWTLDASYIGRLVRCFAPKPGVRTMYQGKALKLIAGEVLATTSQQDAGVVVATKHGLDVACGDGIYRVTQIQPEGKKAMLAADYLRGAQINIGDKLG